MQQSDAVELWDLQMKTLCQILEIFGEQIETLRYELVDQLQQLRLVLVQMEHTARARTTAHE